jgi:2,3-bisphosphoglycerate-dependent phosphoglycerate mutase
MNSPKLNELFLIRHGHPQQGTGIAYDRVPGPPLSDVGREEARIAGLFLGHMGIQRIYGSPLDRAFQTAELIGTELGLTPQTAPLLAEHRKEETFDDVRKRVQELLSLLDQEEAARVALVTHGSPIKALLLALSKDGETLNLDSYKFSNGNHAPTAGVWHARRAESGWQLDLIFKPIVAAPVGHVAV